MKFLKTTAALAALTLPFVAMTPAHAAQLYLGANVGQTFEPSASVSGFDIPLSDDLTYGVSAGAADLIGPFRVEAELRKINTDVLGLIDANSTILFANAFLDLNQDGKIQPYLGAGIGLAKSEVNVFGFTANADSTAWQAVGGVAFKASNKLILDASVRHIDLGDLDFGLGSDVEVTTNAFTVGVRLLV